LSGYDALIIMGPDITVSAPRRMMITIILLITDVLSHNHEENSRVLSTLKFEEFPTGTEDTASAPAG
jgi:hypothetical protein